MFVTLRVYSLSIDNCFGATNHEWPDNRMCTDWHLRLNSLTCTTLIVETTESCQAQIHTSCFFSIILVYYGGLHSETTEFSQTPNCRSVKMMSDVDTRKVRKRLKMNVESFCYYIMSWRWIQSIARVWPQLPHLFWKASVFSYNAFFADLTSGLHISLLPVLLSV
jgi:hypothetical protein